MATEQEARNMAEGLGVSYHVLCHFHNQYNRLPNIPELNSYMNAKGWREPNSGELIGTVPACTWRPPTSQPAQQQPAQPAQPIRVLPVLDPIWGRFGSDPILQPVIKEVQANPWPYLAAGVLITVGLMSQR